MSSFASQPAVRTPDSDTFLGTLEGHGLCPLVRTPATTLQVNVGRVCNQACHHCHVDAGPKRTESMSLEVAEQVIRLLDACPGLQTLDITGGAPELNRHFRWLVQEARGRGLEVIDRCNLTVLLEPGQEDLAGFLAEHGVHVTASLPCYSSANVDGQRGNGVFAKSIEALRRLNALGYGQPGTGLVLDLVYNPGGPFLPPSQEALEADYRVRLGEDFGIVFDRLFTIANMPIKRFGEALARMGELDTYRALLALHFNPATVDGLMCRSVVSVGWDGRLFDCDFNQMLDLPLGAALAGSGATIFDLASTESLTGGIVATGRHCFGCTAGAGSSCGGELA